jgi:hypothetical protein
MISLILVKLGCFWSFLVECKVCDGLLIIVNNVKGHFLPSSIALQDLFWRRKIQFEKIFLSTGIFSSADPLDGGIEFVRQILALKIAAIMIKPKNFNFS